MSSSAKARAAAAKARLVAGGGKRVCVNLSAEANHALSRLVHAKCADTESEMINLALTNAWASAKRRGLQVR